MPVACFLGRGKIHILMNAPSMGVGMGILFVAVISNSIYSVQQTHISTPFDRRVSNFFYNIGIMIL